MKGEMNFPAPPGSPRGKLSSGRWVGYHFDITSVWVGSGALELPVAGRRVMVTTANLQVLHTVFNSDPLALIQERGNYTGDPGHRFVLWFDQVGRETLVTPVVAAHAHHRLDGSGIYIPISTPIDYLVPFHRLYLEVLNYAGGMSDTRIYINVEKYNLDQGDQA